MSPATTIDATDAPRLILAAADRLFYERGIAAVGMDDIRDSAGVSLRRLYGLYPSKRELVAAWLDDRHDRWMHWFTTAIERRSADGVDPLLATFDALVEWAESPGYRGCAFLNAIAETTEIDDAHRAIVAAHKRALIDHLAGLATQSSPLGPTWLAGAIGVLVDGAIVQSAVFGTTQPILDARSAATRLLEALQ